MSLFRRLILAWALALGASQAFAGIPVLDASNLANSVKQVLAWGEQKKQMLQQYQQLVQTYNQAVSTYNSLNGIRGMADLVNNPHVRRYLPDEWNQAVNLLDNPGGYSSLQGSINAIRAAAKVMGVEETGLDPNSPAARAFVSGQTQAAMNRAMSEEAYRHASERITAIQTLIDKVNDAPHQKDIQDLQARIQAEQAMVQNEMVKLMTLAQLQAAQRDIQAQQAREIAMKSTKSATGPARF